MSVGFRVDELRIDAYQVARPPNTSFQYLAHTQLAADLTGDNRPVAIGESGVARDHHYVRDPREIGCQIGQFVVAIVGSLLAEP